MKLPVRLIAVEPSGLPIFTDNAGVPKLTEMGVVEKGPMPPVNVPPRPSLNLSARSRPGSTN